MGVLQQSALEKRRRRGGAAIKFFFKEKRRREGEEEPTWDYNFFFFKLKVESPGIKLIPLINGRVQVPGVYGGT